MLYNILSGFVIKKRLPSLAAAGIKRQSENCSDSHEKGEFSTCSSTTSAEQQPTGRWELVEEATQAKSLLTCRRGSPAAKEQQVPETELWDEALGRGTCPAVPGTCLCVQGEGLGRAVPGQPHPDAKGAGDVGAVRVPRRPVVDAVEVQDVPVEPRAQAGVGQRGQQPRVGGQGRGGEHGGVPAGIGHVTNRPAEP